MSEVVNGAIKNVEKNMVGSLENIQNNLAGTMVNVENNILSAINNLNLSPSTRFPDGIYGWKFYIPGFINTLAQLNIQYPDPHVASDVLVYSKPNLNVSQSNPDDTFIDPGFYQKYLGMKDNVAYWIGTGFFTINGVEGIPISHANNPSGKVLYGHVNYYNFNTLKRNTYGLVTKTQYFTINTAEEAESAIKNNDVVPLLEPTMNNLQAVLQSMGLDVIGDPYAFTYEPIMSVNELNAEYSKILELE